MFDLRLRRAKEAAFEGPARLAARVVGPTPLTAASVTVCVGAGVSAWTGRHWWALGLWWVGRIFDGLDGPVARLRGVASDFGGYLDIIGDTIGYAVIPLGVAAAANLHSTWIAFGALLGSFFVNSVSWTFLAAVLEKQGAGASARGELTTVTMAPALIEGAETIVLFSVFLAFPTAAAALFAVMAGLVSVNVMQRIAWARTNL